MFFGHDRKEETLRQGTPRELTVEVPFGRSMSLEDALRLDLLLAYERNGEPLEKRNGFPLRLIVPGWYGIANVKWLRRIEVRDRRYMGRYMGRDYVTVRGERHGSEVVFVESSVTRMNLKSVVARVMRRAAKDGKAPLKAYGAVWGDGTPIKKVEVQLDGGEWREAKLDEQPLEKYSWRFFSIDLGPVAAGKHTLVSRGDRRQRPRATHGAGRRDRPEEDVLGSLSAVAARVFRRGITALAYRDAVGIAPIGEPFEIEPGERQPVAGKIRFLGAAIEAKDRARFW